MYDLLLSGGTIITCNNSFDIIEDGIIGVKDNKISLTPVEPDLFWRGNLDDLPKISNSFVNPS